MMALQLSPRQMGLKDVNKRGRKPGGLALVFIFLFSETII